MTVLDYIAPVLAFLISFAALVWMIRYRPEWLPLDRPNARSLHRDPVPRAGGLAILLGAGLGSAMAATLDTVWLAIALIPAAVSWIDDRRGVHVGIRFGAQILAAIVFLWASSNTLPWAMLLFTVLGIAWMSNLFNFMDGSDGLAGGMAAIGFGCYGVAAWMAGYPQLSVACWCLVASNLAFLIFNFPPARIFMGDVGSVPLGFLAASIGLFGWSEAIWPIWFPFLVFSYFTIDATVTLLRRVIRRERVWQAHREHAYQRLIRSGWSHRRLALMSWGVMLLAGATALLLLGEPISVVITGLGGWSIVYASLLIAVEVRWRRSNVARGDLSV